MTAPNSQPGYRIVTGFNRFMYGFFVALGVYFLATNELANAMSNLGIALIFDPFRQEQSWAQRPRYQKVWLVVHLIFVFVLLSALLFER